MGRKSEWDEIALTLLWGFDMLTRPSLRRLLEGYEAWEYREYGRHQLRRLTLDQLVETRHHADQIVYRLTDLGRLKAIGGRHPPTQWARAWDQRWRMVLFDLPVGRDKLRQQLLRWLHRNQFGYLQQSAWISPDPLEEIRAALTDYHDDVECLTVLEAAVCAGYSNEALVQGAWSFGEINARYSAHLQLVTRDFQALREDGFRRIATLSWLRDERAAWLHAVTLDPLLPAPLLPSDYQGRKAWDARRSAFSRLARAWGARSHW